MPRECAKSKLEFPGRGTDWAEQSAHRWERARGGDMGLGEGPKAIGPGWKLRARGRVDRGSDPLQARWDIARGKDKRFGMNCARQGSEVSGQTRRVGKGRASRR